MFFQKSAWMDRVVMKKSAKQFCAHVAEKHQGKKVLLFCNNLDAHVCNDVKKIFAEGNVFLYCLPPSVTEALQAIDAGYSRSMRAAVGHLLDNWLMNDENITKWEEGMTSDECHVLISNLVAQANKEVLSNDDMHVGCFRQTGMLLTLDGSDDDKIKPQGCTKLPIQIPVVVDLTQTPDAPEETMTPEEQGGLIAEEDEAIHLGNNDVDEENDIIVEDNDSNESDDESDSNESDSSEKSNGSKSSDNEKNKEEGGQAQEN